MTVKEAAQTYRVQQWTELVKDCKSSGETVAAWCEEKGVCPKTYYYWQKKVREAACQELTLRQETGLEALPFAECKLSNESDSDAAVKLRLSCGTLEIQNGADAAVIENTLRALKNLC